MRELPLLNRKIIKDKYMVSKFRIGVLVIILNSLVSVTTILGQDNPSLLQMAVPSLNIAPDARGGGMGDMGAATLPERSLFKA